ncbi:MAG: glycosyltransferase family 39 protein, partial [Deltaproteobacteria bacterium]|nr:glycosyltransferase family 39 protein [Deltaproteobacteria bacterium]
MPDEKRFTDRKLNINQPYIIGLILIVLTFVVFYPTLENDFINYDDQLYVTANLKVQAGLTQGGFIWAFTNLEASNWHPLTWLSHMLDCQLFGLNPKGHHLTNILFHTANTLLLFLFLNRSTGSLWRSSFVAALFAIHPLHVESVAWIAERKDVLSTFFWMLTMYFYIRYARNPGIMKYSLVLLFFLLGLMSKPMVVTLPFVLLLLDFWPLCRIQSLQPNRNHTAHFTKHINPHRKYTKPLHLVLEKIPLFLISAIFSIITLIAQVYGETVAPLTHLPIGLRISNAFYSYIGYII